MSDGADQSGAAPQHADELRLLECWLPLAQELCTSQGWDDSHKALAALVRVSALLLQSAPSAAAARAILAVYHTALRARP